MAGTSSELSREIRQTAGIKLVFERQHACSERFRCVAWFDWHARLAEDFAGVDFFDHEMNRAAVFALPRFEGAGVGVGAGKLWQQRWMDVDEPPGPRAHEVGG